MTSPTATITGRVVGPDGLGRLGRLTLTPVSLGAPLPTRDIIANRATFRIDTDGYLVGQTGRSVTIAPGNYEIDLNIPGDSGIHIRRRIALPAGQTATLADLLTGTYVPPSPQPQPQPQPQPSPDGLITPRGPDVRRTDAPDVLEASNPAEVIDLGDGVLTWRSLDGGILQPGERGVRASDSPGILEAMDSGVVISPADGLLAWR